MPALRHALDDGQAAAIVAGPRERYAPGGQRGPIWRHASGLCTADAGGQAPNDNNAAARHFTSVTGTSTRCSTFVAIDPIKRPEMAPTPPLPRPRVPMMTCSQPCSRA